MPDHGAEGKQMAALSDNLLIEGLIRGDDSSFEILFYRHYDRVYGILFRLIGNRQEAEDVAQEVFIKLYRQRFDEAREHNLSAWLFRVATNMGYNHVRSRKRRWTRNLSLVRDANNSSGDPAERADRAETRSKVRAVLGQLSERQNQLLILRQMGFSYGEIADICQIAPGSVGTMLSRAADAFREKYEETLT